MNTKSLVWMGVGIISVLLISGCISDTTKEPKESKIYKEIEEYEDKELTDQDIVDTIGMDKVEALANKYDTSEEFVLDAIRMWAKCRSEDDCNDKYDVCDDVSLEEFIFSQTDSLGYFFYDNKCTPAHER